MNKFLTKTKGFLASRKFSSGMLTAMVIAVVIAFNAIVYALTSLLGLYIYSPEEEDFSISGNTDELFADAIALGKKVTIKFCLAKDELEKHDTGRFILKTAKEFENRYRGFIELKYINILTRVDENGQKVSMEKYKKDMEGNDTKLLQSSVIFECGENYRVVTDLYSSLGFADFFSLDNSGTAQAYIGEEIMGSMISWVLAKEHKKVYFTQNHNETADMSLSTLLACAGYTIDFINLTKEPVPADAEFVIISNPTSDFEKASDRPDVNVRTESDRLSDYLKNGGSIYVSVDPFGARLPVLEGILKDYGIELTGAVNEDGRYIRDIVRDNNASITPDGLTFVASGTVGESEPADRIAQTVSRYGSGGVLLSQVGRIVTSGNAKPLLVSSSNSVTYRGENISDREGRYTVAAYSEKINEQGQSSRVFVTSGMYLTAANALITNNYSNKDFMYALFSELFDAPSAIYGTNSITYNPTVLNNFTMGRARIFTVILIAIPVALAAVGTVIIIKRKNR